MFYSLSELLSHRSGFSGCSPAAQFRSLHPPPQIRSSSASLSPLSCILILILLLFPILFLQNIHMHMQSRWQGTCKVIGKDTCTCKALSLQAPPEEAVGGKCTTTLFSGFPRKSSQSRSCPFKVVNLAVTTTGTRQSHLWKLHCPPGVVPNSISGVWRHVGEDVVSYNVQMCEALCESGLCERCCCAHVVHLKLSEETGTSLTRLIPVFV